MSRVVGYTRELVADETTRPEALALRTAGATEVFEDLASVDVRARGGLASCLRALRAGDVLVVTSAVRLSHALSHFNMTRADLARRGVAFRSIAEPALSTATSASPDDVFLAMEALRRRLVGLRTREGMDAAAAVGRLPGRPSVMTPERVAIARELRGHNRSFAHIGRVLGVSPGAVQRALATPV